MDAAQYFEVNPGLHYQKPLGFGGQGVILQYKFKTPDGFSKDIVIKIPVKEWTDDNVRKEIEATRKYKGAAHCSQLLENWEVGQAPLAPYRQRMSQYNMDTSEEEISSGDESLAGDSVYPIKKFRWLRSAWEQAMRERRWAERRAAWPKNLGGRTDFLILEFMEGTSLDGLLRKATKHGRQRVKFPNRVLWAIWLCLVRGITALKYPPRKFHPRRPTAARPWRGPGRPDLLEGIPHVTKRWRAKNTVHFDLDPSNFFMDKIDFPKVGPPQAGPGVNGDAAAEHAYFPRIRLADFGITKPVKPNKRNSYYFYNRKNGKHRYLAPEQFCGEWDSIDMDPAGPGVAQQDVAGNFGPPMNVWGIAITMWAVITQTVPPSPPQPQIPPNVQVPAGLMDVDAYLRDHHPNEPISYCVGLMSPGNLWEYVDEDLRRTIYQCMYHKQRLRPTVETLLPQAMEGALRQFDGEDDETIKQFVNELVFDAPTEA